MDAAAATPVALRLRRSTPAHDAYTVRLADRRVAALATARPADARHWVSTTRWLHASLLHRGCLIVGLGVQWTPPFTPLYGAAPRPAVLQLCVGHRCLVFHLARANADGAAVPEALRRFLADPRVLFVGSGSAHDRRILWDHCGIHVACGAELRAVACMGNASVEQMADRFLGYPGIGKPRDVAVSDWHAPRLSPAQVQYACVDAYLAFRLGLHLYPNGAAFMVPEPAPPAQRAPAIVLAAPPAQRAPAVVLALAPLPLGPAVAPPAPPVNRAPAVVSPASPVKRALMPVRPAAPALRAPVFNRAAPRVEVSPRALSGLAMPAVGAGAAGSSRKVAVTRACLTASDTDSSDDDVDVGVAATHGLPIRAYASDSDEGLSSDGFEHVGFGAFTDEEEDEDDTDNLNEDDQDDVEGYNEYATSRVITVHDPEEEGCKEYSGFGILNAGSEEFIGDGVATANVEEECGGGYQVFEYLGHCEAVLDGGEDALGQDDWYDQEDYGLGQDDEDELEEFYLL